MPEFFRGWKRKVGCVTLMIACLFAAGWVRSLFVVDVCESFTGTARIDFGSRPHFVFVSYMSIPLPGQGLWAITWSTTSQKEAVQENATSVFGEYEWQSFGDSAIGSAMIPFWCLVIPLTLFSAWLLLSKLRAKEQSTESPPGTES